MAPLFFETVPGPAAVDLDPIMTHTCTHARSRTHTQTHGSWLSQREKLEARLLYRDYLSFDSCCSTSKTAAERSKNEKNDIFGVCMGLVGSTELVGKQSRDHSPDFATLNAQSTRHEARPGPTLASWCIDESPACPAAESARKTHGRRRKACKCP